MNGLVPTIKMNIAHLPTRRLVMVIGLLAVFCLLVVYAMLVAIYDAYRSFLATMKVGWKEYLDILWHEWYKD